MRKPDPPHMTPGRGPPPGRTPPSPGLPPLVLHQRQHLGEFEAALPARRALAGPFALVGIAAQRGLAEIQDGRSFMEGEFGIQEAAYDLLARRGVRRSSRPPLRVGCSEFDSHSLV